MSKLIYKDCIIEYYSFQRERREWCGGHSSEGTGVYDTVDGYEVLDHKTMKNLKSGFDSIEAAKSWIKNHKSNKKSILRQKYHNKIKLNEEKIINLEQKRNALYLSFQEKICQLQNKNDELRGLIVKNGGNY